MKSNSLGGILGISLLALSLGFGGSAARADDADTSPLQNIGSEPMASMIQGFEERIAGLEETVRTLSGISEHVTTKELCVADDTGAQTCVSKAQLDALLKLKMQLGQATFSPPAEQPSVAALEPPAIETPAADTTAPAVETAAPPAIGTVAAIVAEVIVTASVAAPGEDQKSDELITGSVASSAIEEKPNAERIE